MGRAVCQAVTEADGLELAALVDADPSQGPVCGLEVTAELRAFAESGCDVVVDFTIAEATRGLVPFLAMHGIHAVIGTSGLSSDDVATFADALDSVTNDSDRPIVVADLGGKVTTFFEYRDCNMLCYARSSDIEPERIRRSLVGALRFGACAASWPWPTTS